MLDLLAPVPALKGATSGRLGTLSDNPGVALQALPEGALLLVIGSVSREDLDAAIRHVGLASCTVSAAGFEQWIIAADVRAASGGLAAALAGKAYVNEQSHGRIRIALSGPRCFDVLAKGCGIDFSIFPPGSGAMTLFGHVGCHLHRTGDTAFHMTVLRSFARALWDELIEAGREYGIDASAP